MLKVITESGSIYLIDDKKKLVTRVVGNSDPTSRQGEDCVWKEYKSLKSIGKCFFFDWTGEGNGTMTSAITFSEDEEEREN